MDAVTPPDAAAWPAPAKLNRMLRIVGRRADGYHLLQTVFQFLAYSDWLWFDVRADGVIERQGEVAGVSPDQDLIVRAARLLQRVAKTPLGATIRIDKRVPMGSGLGGGSSDAATVLVALNAYWRTGLAVTELAELGLQLGADVPVFIHGHAAWAEGVGERLTPMTLEEPWFVVLIPACSIATSAIFNEPELTRNSSLLTIADFVEGVGGNGNDCAAVVYRRYPQVAAAAAWLAQHGVARLTGTGAGVFAAFADAASAVRVLEQIPTDWSGFIARGCNHSPLHERLAQAQCGLI
ncbi:MAG: 4-(cytidine 5'-diphospho)-2-C-methyl-D-erythritol kinase [Candidatus Competibacteraceae bacterium]|nr:4-(cytidine 5'-diphospho)-2-C-methyl-D-erythritol kinase [Candidatus Competibacteraceae bacterium]